MEKITLSILIAFLSFSLAGIAQCGPINTVIGIHSQNDVDNFAFNYPGCTMPYGLYITGATITNLNGLGQITAVVNDVVISGWPTGNPGEFAQLINISGLNNITNIGGTLDISNIPWVNATNIFPNLIHVGNNFNILGKTPFAISGFNSLTTVDGHFTIQSTVGLTGLDGFSNLTTVGLPGSNGEFSFISNNNLTTISGFENLSSVYVFRINGSPSLVSLPDLQDLTTIDGDLIINNTGSLTNLSGLHTLQTIGLGANISFNNLLNSLSGLDNLTSTGGAFTIASNPQLTDLNELQNLNSIGNGALSITNNASLTSLAGLHNIQPSSIFLVYLQNNANLSTCAIASLCGKIALEGNLTEFYVSNNAPNCNSAVEINDACNLSVSENNAENSTKIYPNPVSTTLNIRNAAKIDKVIVLDITGRTAVRSNSSDNAIDVSQLQKGVYIVSVFTESGTYRSKFIKE